MSELTQEFKKAMCEHVKTVCNINDETVMSAILSFNPSGTKKSIDKTLSMLSKPIGLNILLICPNNHVNIGNQKKCMMCNTRLIESCRGKNCNGDGVCPHTRCTYIDDCVKIESRPLHQLLTDLFMVEDENGGVFLTRREHAEAAFHDTFHDILSGFSSINNYFFLQSLEENNIANILRRSVPSAMKKSLNRTNKLGLPPFSCIPSSSL